MRPSFSLNDALRHYGRSREFRPMLCGPVCRPETFSQFIPAISVMMKASARGRRLNLYKFGTNPGKERGEVFDGNVAPPAPWQTGAKFFATEPSFGTLAEWFASTRPRRSWPSRTLGERAMEIFVGFGNGPGGEEVNPGAGCKS